MEDKTEHLVYYTFHVLRIVYVIINTQSAAFKNKQVAEISNIRNDLNQVKTFPISQQLESFAGEKDASGNLKRPFFNDVRSQMGVFMQNGLANSLEDAYEQAVWANPTTRQKFNQEANRAAVLKKQQEERERATKAKNASSHIKSGGVEKRTGGADLSELELGDHLKQVAKDLGYEF